MRRRVLVNPFQKRVAGQPIEEVIGAQLVRMMADSVLLMRPGFMGIAHIG